MKLKNFTDFALFITCYTSFCLTVFLFIQGLAFIPTSSDAHHKILYEVLVSVVCTWVMGYLVEHHLITNGDQIVGLSECIIVMHEKLKRHSFVLFVVEGAFPVIGMLMIVDRPFAVCAPTVSFLTFVIYGCSCYTTPRAAAIVARPISYISAVTLVPVAYGRSNYVVLGLLLLLTICCFRSSSSAIEEKKEKTELVGGTHPKSL